MNYRSSSFFKQDLEIRFRVDIFIEIFISTAGFIFESILFALRTVQTSLRITKFISKYVPIKISPQTNWFSLVTQVLHASKRKKNHRSTPGSVACRHFDM